MPPLTKKYLQFCFSHNLEQIITSPAKTTDRTETLIDHVLKNSSQEGSQSRVIDVGLSDHDIIFWTRKKLKPKTHKHCKILVRSFKHYTKENFDPLVPSVH